MHPRKGLWIGAMHRARPRKKLAAKADAGARVRVRGITGAKFGWKTGFARKCADDGRAEAGERQPVPGAAC